jgi:hypothetical protein
MTKRQ